MSEASKAEENPEAGAEEAPKPVEAPKEEPTSQPEQPTKHQQQQIQQQQTQQQPTQLQQQPTQPLQQTQPVQQTQQQQKTNEQAPSDKKQTEQNRNADNGNDDEMPSTPETERPNRPQRIYREIVEDTRAKSPSPWTNRSRMVSPVRLNGPDSPYRFAVSARSRPSSRERIVRPPDR